MAEVIYSINNRFFKDFGVYISESKGLLDKPKPKARKSYDWAEQHGKQIDLSRPKYDEQDIELKGFVLGQNWAEMKANFDTLFSEFDKQGLVRLLVDFGEVLVFDVYLSDSVELEKKFKNGDIIGTFTLKLKAPYPIKRVFALQGSDFKMSFATSDWLIMNIDGVQEKVKGIVDISRVLEKRQINSELYPNRGEDMHYIALYGNVDEIMNLTTNATEIWKYTEYNKTTPTPITPKVTGAYSKGFSTGFRI